MSDAVNVYDNQRDATPEQRALLGNALYQQVLHRTIADIQDYLHDTQDLCNIYASPRTSSPADDGPPKDYDSEEYENDDFNLRRFSWSNLKSLFSFAWFTIKDGFKNNPYKLPAFIYMMLFVSLATVIAVQWALVVYNVTRSMKKGKGAIANEEFTELLNSAVSVLPVVVQSVLFLFPPLLANAAV